MRVAISKDGRKQEIFEVYVGDGPALGWEWFVTAQPNPDADYREGFVQSPLCPRNDNYKSLQRQL